MEYSIKSKIVNASEADISNFHWEKYKLHKCSDTFISFLLTVVGLRYNKTARSSERGNQSNG